MVSGIDMHSEETRRKDQRERHAATFHRHRQHCWVKRHLREPVCRKHIGITVVCTRHRIETVGEETQHRLFYRRIEGRGRKVSALHVTSGSGGRRAYSRLVERADPCVDVEPAIA